MEKIEENENNLNLQRNEQKIFPILRRNKNKNEIIRRGKKEVMFEDLSQDEIEKANFNHPQNLKKSFSEDSEYSEENLGLNLTKKVKLMTPKNFREQQEEEEKEEKNL